MKNHLPRLIAGRLVRNLFLFSLFVTALIYSCKKDNTATSTVPLDNAAQTAAIKDAKAWFETNAKINTPAVVASNAVNERKWSEGLNPDWEEPLVYEKNKNMIVEMPLANGVLVFALNRNNGIGITPKDNYTKTSL